MRISKFIALAAYLSSARARQRPIRYIYEIIEHQVSPIHAVLSVKLEMSSLITEHVCCQLMSDQLREMVDEFRLS